MSNPQKPRNPGHIDRVRQIAGEQGWEISWNEARGQRRNGVFIHTADLYVADAFRKTPVKVACGIGPNVMAARDDACRGWLIQNGYIPAQ